MTYPILEKVLVTKLNHFIELGQVEEDKESVWVTIHTGSRNLGIKILAYWKKQIGKTRIIEADMKAAERGIKEKYKGQGKKIKEEIEKTSCFRPIYNSA